MSTFSRVAWLPILMTAACSDTSVVDGGPAPDVGFYDGGPGVDGCPPSGVLGVQEGDILPNPSLVDCDGNAYSLQALCGKKAAWQFHLAGW